MKNILIDVRYLENNKTGIAVGLEAFLSELEKIDIKHNIYLLYNNNKTKFKFKHIKINSNLFTIKEHTELYKIFKKYSIDIYYSHHFISPLLKGRVKVINIIHDLIPLHIDVLSFLGKSYYYLMNYITMKKSEIIVTNSYATKYDIEKFYKRKDVRVIYHSFNKKKLIKLNNRIFNKLNLEKNNYFLFVSSLKKHKNYENIIKAFKIYNKYNKNSKLVLVGKKDKELNLIKDDNIIFTNFISDEELNSLYRYAKGLLFVSLIEGFGVPILEAQYHQCPVITSNTSSMPEVAGKGALVVNPYNIKEIYEAMKKLDDKEIVNKLKKEGVKNINRFSWNKYTLEVVKIFEELK